MVFSGRNLRGGDVFSLSRSIHCTRSHERRATPRPWPRFIWWIWLPILLVACAGTPTQVTSSDTEKSPPPTISVQASSPTLSQTALAPDGGGTVTGRLLLLQSGSEFRPIVGRILYLARTIKDRNGDDGLAALNRVESARAQTDADGRFFFQKVAAGRYGLVLDLVVQAYILLQPDQSTTLLFDVASGQSVDLGDLKYLSLPPGASRP